MGGPLLPKQPWPYLPRRPGPSGGNLSGFCPHLQFLRRPVRTGGLQTGPARGDPANAGRPGALRAGRDRPLHRTRAAVHPGRAHRGGHDLAITPVGPWQSRAAMTCRPVFFLRTCRVRKWFLLLPLTVGMALRGAEIKINFGDFAAGQTPTNFFSALAGSGPPGDWKIVLDTAPPLLAPLTPQAQQTAAAFRQPVLAQLSQDRTDNRFPLFIYDGQVFKDFKLTTQFKIVGGTMEQMAGIVFRYQNASNFYVFRASALGHNVRFYKLVNGKFVDPSPPLDLNIATNVWHTLSVQCEGNRINCTLD